MLGPSLIASSPVLSSCLFDNGLELVFDVLDDARANRVLDLLREDASLVIVVLQAHSGDLIRNAWLFKVLQRPNKEERLAHIDPFNERNLKLKCDSYATYFGISF